MGKFDFMVKHFLPLKWWKEIAYTCVLQESVHDLLINLMRTTSQNIGKALSATEQDTKHSNLNIGRHFDCVIYKRYANADETHGKTTQPH